MSAAESDLEDFRRGHSGGKCPVCGMSMTNYVCESEQGGFHIECGNCGTFMITESALLELFAEFPLESEYYDHRLSHRIRKSQTDETPPVVDDSTVRLLRANPPPEPTVFEQVENLIIHLAENFGPGETTTLSAQTCLAAVGAEHEERLSWVLKAAMNRGWIDGEESADYTSYMFLYKASLTLDGWEWYDEIGRHRQSKVAFMAMPFGEPDVAQIVDEYFRPAVRKAGFNLMRLDDLPKAGIIDNQIRVEIRRSRLLVCDITHNNTGAIWEAGFAEGLWKPVIYTCEQSALDGAHFDIRNCQIVPWLADDPSEAADELKATIRNTLPEEAVLDD